MKEQTWNPHTSVVVCGVEGGTITLDGTGSQSFQDFESARAVFPDLDPTANTQRFTWALGHPQTDVMRFETSKANDLYSK